MSDQREAERARIKRLAGKLGIQPTRSMGQNFLIDRTVIERTVAFAQIELTDTVLEIGPGLGMLTGELSERCARLVVVELDMELAAYLRSEYGGSGRARVVETDARHVSLTSLGLGPETKVVANLPYSVGTVIVRHLLETEPRPQSLTVMLQREVAERMAAQPPDASLLSLSVQLYAEPEIGFLVPQAAFWPEPKVESAVISLLVRAEPVLVEPARALLFRLATAAFRAKRKTLANSLSAALGVNKTDMSTMLQQSGIDPMARPQHIGLAQWAALIARLQADGIAGV